MPWIKLGCSKTVCWTCKAVVSITMLCGMSGITYSNALTVYIQLVFNCSRASVLKCHDVTSFFITITFYFLYRSIYILKISQKIVKFREFILFTNCIESKCSFCIWKQGAEHPLSPASEPGEVQHWLFLCQKFKLAFIVLSLFAFIFILFFSLDNKHLVCFVNSIIICVTVIQSFLKKK